MRPWRAICSTMWLQNGSGARPPAPPVPSRAGPPAPAARREGARPSGRRVLSPRPLSEGHRDLRGADARLSQRSGAQPELVALLLEDRPAGKGPHVARGGGDVAAQPPEGLVL